MPELSRKEKEGRVVLARKGFILVLLQPLSLLTISLTLGFFVVFASFADDIDFLMRIFRGELPIALLATSFGYFLIEFLLTAPRVALLLLLLVALLAGIQLSLMIYFVQQRGSLVIKGLLGSGLGIGALFLGLGCVACGSFFLSAFFTLGGFAFAITNLPFSGMEFYLLSLAFFLAGIARTTRALKRAAVC
ncbi:MAG: hypothetical protein HY006_02375 [Candidatus Sungbacteria bacterium]|nr:hypothetical protein [Candidatus Sungbacteria bacterium]